MEVKLIVASGKNQGKEIALPGPHFLIGRGEGCQLRPASERISRKHCAIIVAEGRVIVRDLGSTNGTFVNKERITGDRELKNGDKLNVGGVLDFEVQITVEVGGKKSPKVHSIQEAAARTVQKAASDDLDISQWLEDAEQDSKKISPSLDLNLNNTSIVDQNLADTSTIQLPKKQEREGGRQEGPGEKTARQDGGTIRSHQKTHHRKQRRRGGRHASPVFRPKTLTALLFSNFSACSLRSYGCVQLGVRQGLILYFRQIAMNTSSELQP